MRERFMAGSLARPPPPSSEPLAAFSGILPSAASLDATMRLEVEPILCQVDRSFTSLAIAAPRFACPYHRHPELELVAIDASGGRLVVGDHVGAFAPGDIFLLGPDLPHIFQNTAIESGGGARALVVQFRHDFAGPGLFALPEMAPVRRLLQAARRGLAVGEPLRSRLRTTLEAIHAAPGARRVCLLLEALVDLAGTVRCTRPLASAGYDPASVPAEGRMAEVLACIQEGLADELAIPDLARLAGLTPNAFSRWFRQQTGRTCIDLINGLRIREAVRLLDETAASVTEVCFSCGFGNLAHFHAEFRRRIGCPPGRYRQRTQERP
jgi:AraC-like DNA-binding protein